MLAWQKQHNELLKWTMQSLEKPPKTIFDGPNSNFYVSLEQL